MSPKRLLPLVGILLVLGLLAVWLKRQPPSSQLAEEVGLVRLVPSTFRAEAVSGVDLALGSAPQDVLRLRKRDGTWWIPSRFDAPANSMKMQQLLTQVSDLQGELRAESAELLEDFRLKDEQALHLKVYLENAETPALSLLAGKSSGSNGFMRRSGENRVYAVNLNVQALAGVSSSTPESSLSAKPWLELRLQNVPKEQVSAVELQAPARVLHFTTVPAEAGPGSTPMWKLQTPALPYPVKSEAVDSLVTTLRTLQGDDVVDPALAASYGLDAPTHRAVLTVQASGQEAKPVAILFGTEVPEKSGSRYVRLSTGGPVYIVPEWTWKRLFPMLGTLLDLRLLQASEADVMRLTVQHDGATWEVARDGTEASAPWRFVGQTEATLDETALRALLGIVTQLTAEDLPATLPAESGLEQPTLQLTLTLRDGRTASVSLGQPVAPEGGGFYASRGEASEVVILAATTQRTLLDAVTKLQPGAAASGQDTTRP
ncbi:MAG: DUF4340 domain-containing protein [Candidatus Tectimicrobiota bacterium]